MPTAENHPRLLLDTHVWIWLLEGVQGSLSARAMELLNRSSTHGRLLVSVISVWEVAILVTKRRISLTQPLDLWVSAGLSAPGVRLAPLTPEIAIESTRLPGVLHGDPADRIMIATARAMAASLMTCDRAILGYANAGHLQAFDARVTDR